MNKLFDFITRFLNGIEDSFINVVSIIVPWFVPIIPAYLTYYHSTTNLKFPWWVAWTAAFVVEVLGLASMRTSISFYEHNRRYSNELRQAPFGLAFSTYVFYLFVVLTVNVLLDVQNGVAWVNVLAVGLFSLLSVPAGVLISVRAQHTELVRDIERAKAERRTMHTARTVPERSAEPPKRSPERHASDFLPKIIEVLESTYVNENRIAGPTEIARKVNLDPDKAKGYISTKTKEWKTERGL